MEDRIFDLYIIQNDNTEYIVIVFMEAGVSPKAIIKKRVGKDVKYYLVLEKNLSLLKKKMEKVCETISKDLMSDFITISFENGISPKKLQGILYELKIGADEIHKKAWLN